MTSEGLGEMFEGDSSPGSQPPPKYRTGKNSIYRRYRLFSSANIGGFKENFRRFISFEGQL
jgi:hypothetical protein